MTDDAIRDCRGIKPDLMHYLSDASVVPSEHFMAVRESLRNLGDKSLMHTAMCLWEAVIDDENMHDMTKNPSRWTDLRANVGSFTVREAVTHLVAPCEVGWALMGAEFGEMHAISFDFDYVPLFLKACVTAYPSDPFVVQMNEDWPTLLRAAMAFTYSDLVR